MRTEIKTLLTPIFNETWEKALVDVRERTPEGSVVNAWWPPGHFIKAIAHRRVVFDGATINFPQAYWVANVFLSDNETDALGMLRMLDVSGNDAAQYLKELGVPLSTAVPLLKEIAPLDKTRAEIFLSTLLKNTDQRDHLLTLTHGQPPPAYLFLYNEFVETNLQLAFFGKWNFKRIEEINKDPSLLSQVPPHNSPEYVQYLWQMVGGPYRFSGVLNQLGRIGDNVFFDENIRVDLRSKSCLIDSKKYGRGIPQSIFYLEEGTNDFTERRFEGNDLNFSVALIKEEDHYSIILMDRPLATSLLVRLYYFDGAGLKHIKPFNQEADLTKRTVIKIFEVDWEGFEKDVQEGKRN